MLAEIVPLALVATVAFVVGVLSSTFGSGRKAGASSPTAMAGVMSRLDVLERAQKATYQECLALGDKVEKTTNARLAVEVDALGGAIEALKVSNRREFGKLWGRLNGLNGETSPSDDAPDRDTLRAQYLKPPMGAAP